MVVGVTAANTHDSVMLVPMLDGLPTIRSRRGPRRRRPGKLHADKAYDSDELRTQCRRRGITPRIARRSIESSERLGRWRWKIERTVSWIFGYRRLTIRYERKATYFAAFLSLAATLTCYKRLAKVST
jgi:IS5 family transposase